MKKTLLLAIALLLSIYCVAQQQLSFPFQGGSTAMSSFFRDSLTVSPEIMKTRAAGMVVFKFSADDKGVIKNLVVYYADDAILVPPVIEALKRSNHKWITPDKEKVHDFILPFSIRFNPPAPGSDDEQKAFYNYSMKRKPILSVDQVPLNQATLLPAVIVKYDIKD
jgi:hypothetical protein